MLKPHAIVLLKLKFQIIVRRYILYINIYTDPLKNYVKRLTFYL